MPALIHPLPS